MSIFLSILFGFLSGILGGLGMGGGTLLIPLLTIFLSYEQKLCQGINLISFLIMSLFSLIIHSKNNYLKLHGIVFIVFSGIIFSIIGSLLAGSISNNILKISFGIFLCILAMIQVLKVFKK